MKFIAEVDYDAMEWIYVTNHWDIHLSGLCRYNGELCWFETFDEREWEKNPLYIDHIKCYWPNKETGVKEQHVFEWEEYREIGRLYCKVYSLSTWEKIKHLWQKKKFEICVGYHWSYDRRGKRFDHPLPRWLRNYLYRLYFGRWPYNGRLAGDQIT